MSVPQDPVATDTPAQSPGDAMSPGPGPTGEGSPAPVPPSPAPPSPFLRFLRSRWTITVAVLLLVSIASYWWWTSLPSSRVARARTALARRDFASAERIAAGFQASDPDLATLLRAETALARDQPDEALTLLSRITPKSDRFPEANVLTGKACYDMGRLNDAVRAYNLALAEQPDNLEAHRGLAGIAYDMGVFDKAALHLSKVADLNTKDGRAPRLLGLIRKDLGQHEEALGSYESALNRKLEPGTAAQVREEMAEVLVKLSRFESALEVLDRRAKDRTQETPGTYRSRAEALAGLAQSSEALAVLGKAVLAYEKSPEPWALRGKLLLQGGDAEAAAADLEEAEKLAPGDYESRFLLAQAYEKLGRTADAAAARFRAEIVRKLFDELTEKTKQAMQKQGDAGLRREMGALYDKLGKPDLAATMYRTAAGMERK